MPVSAEFLCFCGTLRNLVLDCDIVDKDSTFWSGTGGHTVCMYHFAMKYMTDTRTLTEFRKLARGWNLERLLQQDTRCSNEHGVCPMHACCRSDDVELSTESFAGSCSHHLRPCMITQDIFLFRVIAHTAH